MFSFLKRLFSGLNFEGVKDTDFSSELPSEPSIPDGPLDVEALNRQEQRENEFRYQNYQRQLCGFDPHSLSLYPASPNPHLTSVELAFLKYVGRTSATEFCPAQYWYYEYGLDYKNEITKFLSEDLLIISSAGDIEKKTVPQLKEILKTKTLPLTGKKADLINRVQENFSEEELTELFPKGKEFYKLTPKGKVLTATVQKSATKNIELEDRCLQLLMNGQIDEAYKEIAWFRAAAPGQTGIGIDWEREVKLGASKRDLSSYGKTLRSAKSENERLMATCYVLCEMLGIPHKINFLISRVGVGNPEDSFLPELVQSQLIQSIKQELQEYKQSGYQKYQIIGTLDTSTCSKCGQMDCQVFDITSAKIGVNCPPFHIGCRCIILPHITGVDTTTETRWARDPTTGKGIQIPSMNYTEWYKKYVESK
ncbi:MAG: minor capsid protein [Clostridium sp.]|nr:minor capsid protein [Clostridium sp.]